MPELVADPRQRLPHRMCIGMLRKVDKRFVAERALRRTREDNGGCFDSSHNTPV